MLIFDPIYNGYFQLLGQNLENFCWGLEQIMYMQGINVLSENLLLEILKVLPSWIIERTSGWNSQQFCICWVFSSLYIASKLYIYWNNLNLSYLVVCGSHPFWVGSKISSRPNLVLCKTHPRRPARSALLPLQACPSPDFSTFFRLRPFMSDCRAPLTILLIWIWRFFWLLVSASMSRSRCCDSRHFTSFFSAIWVWGGS